jgi:SAM-dependent methyltransferase
MKIVEAVELIRDAVGNGSGVWADLGAGTGTFTQALTRVLDAASTVYAIDVDPRAVRALRELSSTKADHVRVIAVKADFTRPLELCAEGQGSAQLDGILLANALHFVRDAERVLSGLAQQLRPGGRAVVVEYDRREASQWVPFPISAARWPGLAASAGLADPRITATRPSSFAGILYTGVATRVASGP